MKVTNVYIKTIDNQYLLYEYQEKAGGAGSHCLQRNTKTQNHLSHVLDLRENLVEGLRATFQGLTIVYKQIVSHIRN